MTPLPARIETSKWIPDSVLKLPGKFRARDFVPFFPKLRNVASESIRIQFRMEACPGAPSSTLRAGLEGARRFLSFQIPFVFEIVADESASHDEAFLARSGGTLSLVLSSSADDDRWTVNQAELLADTATPCGVDALPDGLRLSLDWMFRKPDLWSPLETSLSEWLKPRHFFVLEEPASFWGLWLGPSF
jgi:hypothetical protein